MVAAFATVVLMLVCTPIFELFGRVGLLTFLVFCVVTSTLLAYRTRRLTARVRS
jgi:hypothetical protein